ncbi:MAG: UDP-N-acetylmuramoyl-L-alanyl-D-glutamate--2,6-diaminopimelate ligase [Acetobacteraceae bacterium]|nr:UDP-N-acetylmuramoyl-L-alanyl-D-glutamate--2,6-diaminopimelate ligase [Acetobacteraceae bacterium]
MGHLHPAPDVAWRDGEDTGITGITADSRAVAPGFLFAALPGAHHDGRTFIAEAVARGASAILAPLGTSWPPATPRRLLLTAVEPRRCLAQLATAMAGPQPAMTVAVTGTNGKTSTVSFLRQLWALSGIKSASLGTLGLDAPGFASSPGLTTPDPVALAGTLAALVKAKIGHVALEASSHGLDQFRLDGVQLKAGGFTNLTRDHLDYHRTLPAYRAAKLRLFTDLLPAGAPVVVNADMDGETLRALRTIAQARRLDLRSVGMAGETIGLMRATPHPGGQSLRVFAHGRVHTIDLPLLGRFQTDNALVAAALAEATGTTHALNFLPHLVGVRGRMERAAILSNDAAVYVDYAHTPDALDRLLAALRPHVRGKLIIVFGAGGDRDHGKRPLMGASAARGADHVIITDDNPRTENPATIRSAIRSACPDATEIADRANAIAAGLNLLGPGDILAVAGKGHEQGQIIGLDILPFDDIDIVRRLAGRLTDRAL